MKIKIFIILIGIIAASCKQQTNPTSDFVHSIPGVSKEKPLTEKQLEKVKFIQETFKEVYSVSLNQTIANFERNENPEQEINIWMDLANAFTSFANKNIGIEKREARQEAFQLLINRSMLPEKEAIAETKTNILTTNEIEEILALYNSKANPINVNK